MKPPLKHIPAPELELEDGNGVVYPLMFPGRHLSQVSGLGMPPIQHWTTRSPFQQGQSHWGYAFQPRVINMVVYLKGCSRQGMWDKRMANIEMLTPLNGAMILRLITPNLRKYELHDVWYQQGYELDSADQAIPRTQVGGLTLIAYDPMWKWVNAPLGAGQTRDADGRICVTDDTFTLTPQLVFPFTPPFLLGTTIATESWTVVYGGTWAVKPIITVEGPVDDWVIENTTTGQELDWNGYSIAAAEIVTIDIPNKTATNGAGTSLSSYLSGDTGDFSLNPGNNTVTFWASGGVVNGVTTVGICWYVEILGV